MTYREVSDNLADIIWWLKGYIAAMPKETERDMENYHIESLRLARLEFMRLAEHEEAKK